MGDRGRKQWSYRIQTAATFGAVGILATAVHFSIGLSLTETGIARPVRANFVAFIAAFMVSYAGHYRFTFRSSARHRQAAPKFLTVALVGLLLNQLIVYAMVDLWDLQYILALVVVLMVVPVLTFLMGRFWVFNTKRVAAQLPKEGET